VTSPATTLPTTTTVVAVVAPDGLAGVRLGQDATGALKALDAMFGAPSSDSVGCNENRSVRVVTWRSHTDLSEFVQALFLAGAFVQLIVTSPAVRTAEGIGVGTALEGLKAAYGSQLTTVDGGPAEGEIFAVGSGPAPHLVGGLSGVTSTDRVTYLESSLGSPVCR